MGCCIKSRIRPNNQTEPPRSEERKIAPKDNLDWEIHLKTNKQPPKHVQPSQQSSVLRKLASEEQRNKCRTQTWIKSQQQALEEENSDLAGMQRLFRQMFVTYQQCLYYYKEHNIDFAYLEAQKLQQKKEEIQKKYVLNEYEFKQEMSKEELSWMDECVDHIADVYRGEVVEQVQKQYKDVVGYEEEIKQGWVQKENKDGIKLFTREEKDNKVGAMVETETEIPFQILISVLTEMSLYQKFLPFNELSRHQKTFSRNCKIGYSVNNYPILSRREVYFQGIGYDRLQTNKQIFMYTRSIQDNPQLLKYLQFEANLNPDYVPICYKYFICKYHPIRRGLGKITLAMNADMGLKLPMFIEEFLIKDFAKNFFKSILEISKEYTGSKWEQKVQENPDLFLFFKTTIENYLKDIDQ